MLIKNALARITIDLPIDLQKQLKTISAINRMSMREIVIKSIKRQLKEMQKEANCRPIQKNPF